MGKVFNKIFHYFKTKHITYTTTKKANNHCNRVIVKKKIGYVCINTY